MGNINIKRYKRGAHIAIADSILNAMNECLGVQLLWVLARVPPLRLAKNSNCCSDYLVLEPRRFLSIHHTKRESNYLPLSFFVPCVCSCWFPSAALFFILQRRSVKLSDGKYSGHPHDPPQKFNFRTPFFLFFEDSSLACLENVVIDDMSVRWRKWHRVRMSLMDQAN